MAVAPTAAIGAAKIAAAKLTFQAFVRETTDWMEELRYRLV